MEIISPSFEQYLYKLDHLIINRGDCICSKFMGIQTLKVINVSNGRFDYKNY